MSLQALHVLIGVRDSHESRAPVDRTGSQRGEHNEPRERGEADLLFTAMTFAARVAGEDVRWHK